MRLRFVGVSPRRGPLEERDRERTQRGASATSQEAQQQVVPRCYESPDAQRGSTSEAKAARVSAGAGTREVAERRASRTRQRASAGLS